MRWTIQRRLTVWYAGFLLLVLLVLGLVLYQSLASSLRNEAARSVAIEAQSLIASFGASEPDKSVENDEEGSHFDITDPDLIKEHGSPGMYIEIEDAAGILLNQSLELRGHSLASGDLEASLAGSNAGTTEIRNIPQIGLVLVYSIPLEIDTSMSAILRVGRSIEFISDALAQLRFVLLVLAAVGVALAVIVGTVLAKRALAPIDRITQIAQQVGIEDLHQRLHLEGPNDEVTRLANAFDKMLRRVEDGFLRERQFSSDVAHELRTPLTILKGTAEVALRPKEKDILPCRETLESIEEEIDRMIRLVEALLLLSRSEAGQFPLMIEKVSLYHLCKEAIESLTAIASNKGVNCSTNLVEDIVVDADIERIRQLLRNLLTNAIKYTPPSGQVTLSLQRDGLNAVISVEDNGIGISTRDLPHIFKRFYRVDRSRSRSEGGIGLGLSIALAIAETHGGRIDVTSQENKGTTFALRLPLS